MANSASRAGGVSAAPGLLKSAGYEPERGGGEERYRIDLGGEVRAFTAGELCEIASACAAGKRWDELGVEGAPAGLPGPGETDPERGTERDAEPADSGEERLIALERDTLAEDNPIGAALTEDERARATAEFERFVAQYPDVTDLPVEVVQAVRRGTPLLDAYRAHENGALRAKLAALEQNERNARRSPGSARGDGDGDADTAELMAIFDSVFR